MFLFEIGRALRIDKRSNCCITPTKMVVKNIAEPRFGDPLDGGKI